MKRVAVLLVLVALLVGVAAAQGGGGRRGPGGFGLGEGAPILGYITRHLDLTDAQKAEVKKILDAERSVMQPIREQMQKNREALQEATKDGQFNETQVTQLAQKQGELMAQMIVSRERVKSQVYQILTAEQRQKLSEMQDKAGEWRGMRGGRRGK